jgi:replicative DNA helicase
MPKSESSAPVEVLGLVNADAEAAVLAAMRGESSEAVRYAQELAPDDFHDPRHRLLFEAIANLLHGVEPIDNAAIVAECRRVADVRGEKVRVDADYLQSATGDPRRAAMYAHTVRRLAWLRRAADFAHWMIGELQTRPDPDDLFAASQERWQTLRPATKDTRFLYGWDTVGVHRDVIRKRIAEHEAGVVTAFRWPWASWNRDVKPLRPGFVGVIAAPDGMGKTTYLEMVAEQWAHDGLHVVYVHLEDDPEYKLDRRLARHARIEIDKIERGELTPPERQQVADAQSRLDDWAGTLHYYHAAGETMTGIVRELETRVAEGVCQAVIFDYLDKVQPTRGQIKAYGENAWERQANDMELLKSFAERSRLPVLTATQGNKSMQTPGVQTRKAIQGSGQKAQKAQLVIILTRDLIGDGGLTDASGKQIARPGEYSPVVHVRIDKQNRGQTGQFDQAIVGRFFTVRDVQHGPERVAA